MFASESAAKVEVALGVLPVEHLIGSCEDMEATYCMGSDVDVCRMFDQYLYKVNTDLFILSYKQPLYLKYSKIFFSLVTTFGSLFVEYKIFQMLIDHLLIF